MNEDRTEWLTREHLATVTRVLDAMGYDRVRRGLQAFEHEPVDSFCNCFATDAFAHDLEPWPTSQRERLRLDAITCGPRPRWRHSGERLDAPTIARFLGVGKYDAYVVFGSAYEHYPDQLLPIIIDWMDRYEREHFEVTR